jgi:excisionase family DNA binding protein
MASELDAARERLREQADAANYITIEAAAEIAHCNPKTLRRVIERGELEAFRPAQRLLFREADVYDWIESHPARSGPVAPAPRPRARRRGQGGAVSVAESLREMDPDLRRRS